MQIRAFSMVLFIISILCIQIQLTSQAYTKSTSFENTNEKFDDEITFATRNRIIPSVSGCIVSKSAVIWCKGYGEQPDIHSIYYVGSITKSFIATSFFQLKDQNLITFDEDVNNWLPYNISNPHYPNEPITIKELLTHTSSLADDTDINDFDFWEEVFYDAINISYTFGYPRWLQEQLTPGGFFYKDTVWTTNKPGTTFAYSNVGFALLGYILELITHQTLDQYMQQHIFDPLEMKHSAFNLSYLNKSMIVNPYDSLGEQMPKYEGLLYGMGGLKSSASDLSHFLLMHMNNGLYNGISIISEQSAIKMHSYAGFGGSYGYGWEILIDNSGSGHSGATAGGVSQMFYNNEYGAIILADKHCTPGTNCGYDFLQFWNVLYSNKEIFPRFITKPDESVSFTRLDTSKYLEWAVKSSETLTYDLYVDNSIVQSAQVTDNNTIRYQVDTSSTGVYDVYIEIISASGLVNYHNVTVTIGKKSNSFFTIPGFTMLHLDVVLPILLIYLGRSIKNKKKMA